MLQPADDQLVWGSDGRTFMTASSPDHFIPKQLLLFDPTSHSQYPAPIFFSQHQSLEQDKVAAERISGGLNDTTNYDHGMILDDPLTSKPHMTNDRNHHHVYIKTAHDPLHHHDRVDPHDHQRLSSSYNYNNTVRTCVDCNTTKTPLWRSGPLGPKVTSPPFIEVIQFIPYIGRSTKVKKSPPLITSSCDGAQSQGLCQSLCNACGIRHHKARRAKAAAAESQGGSHDPFPVTNKLKKQKRGELKSTGHCKRKNKIFTTPRRRKNLCFELDLNCEIEDDQSLEYSTTAETLDFAMELSKAKPFKRVFPEDEEQAAILLMALSCGLVHG
ncbi:putative GATA transcription factor 22 [Nymphaea thermarum]|nr:putative GATA transcription factor 22 [Nymphaea thermarum]